MDKVQEPVKSCANCPSFLTITQASTRNGRSTGSAMCGRFGTILSRKSFSDQENVLLQESIGGLCKRHGEELPDVATVKLRPMVANADDEAEAIIKNMDATKHVIDINMIKSCNQCMFYIPPQEVTPEFEWPAGLCSKRGLLILSNKTSQMASECSERRYSDNGQPLIGIRHMKLHDLYTHEFYEGRISGNDQVHDLDPTTYITDKPVTEAEAQAGVRAWRLVSNPDNEKQFTYHPIFEREYFSATEQAKIPATGDDEHPELYQDHNNAVYRIIVSWLELQETPILWGPAGVGKTELGRYLAWWMQIPFERFSITASTELDDLAGKMLYEKEKGTYFERGRLPLAWAKPSILLLDEPNTAAPEVWQFLRPLTDNSKQLVLDFNHGERIDRHVFAFMLMAANPSWDPRNVGAQTIGDADGSRLMHLRMGLPPKSIEEKILNDRVSVDGWSLTKPQMRLIMDSADDIRKLVDNQTLAEITWGIRMQIKVARALRWFDPLSSFRMATDHLEPGDQEQILSIVKAHIPPEPIRDKERPVGAYVPSGHRKRVIGGKNVPTAPASTSNMPPRPGSSQASPPLTASAKQVAAVNELLQPAPELDPWAEASSIDDEFSF